MLTTVLFTDIVDSTGRAASVGDRAWRQLLDRRDEIARTEVAEPIDLSAVIDLRFLDNDLGHRDGQEAHSCP